MTYTGTAYNSHPRFHVAVDCIIFGLVDGKLNLLLTRRRFEPEKGKWSLMGGFTREDESIDNAARRVLFELTGLEDVFMKQVGAFGEIDRDPETRVVSVAYYALIGREQYDADRLKAHDAEWCPVDTLPELGFDHPLMVHKALKMLRSALQYKPIGFNLLPELFTLTQLQQLYETILGEPIDKRNFRKRIAETQCIEKTDLIDKERSRRGATLYRFNDNLYEAEHKFKI